MGWSGGRMDESKVYLSEKEKSDAIEDLEGGVFLNGKTKPSGYDWISQKVDELLDESVSSQRRVTTYKETLLLAHKALETISKEKDR